MDIRYPPFSPLVLLTLILSAALCIVWNPDNVSKDLKSIFIITVIVVFFVMAATCGYVTYKRKKRENMQLENIQLGRQLNQQREELSLVTDENISITQAWDISWSEITLGKVIGKGAFGIVNQALWRDMSVAVKAVPCPTAERVPVSLDDLRKEILTLRRVRHPNIGTPCSLLHLLHSRPIRTALCSPIFQCCSSEPAPRLRVCPSSCWNWWSVAPSPSLCPSTRLSRGKPR